MVAQPYSTNLQENIITSIAPGRMPRRQAGECSGVAASTAIIRLQWLHRTGGAATGQVYGQNGKKLIQTHRDLLIERCNGRFFTLRGLQRDLAAGRHWADCRSM